MRLAPIAALALSGCATLEPDALRTEVRHESHVTQHEPFTDHQTHYGRTLVGLDLRWVRKSVTLEVGEAYSVLGMDGSKAPRELFEARIGYDIPLKR